MKVFAFILEWKSGKFSTKTRSHSFFTRKVRLVRSARLDRVWGSISFSDLPEPPFGMISSYLFRAMEINKTNMKQIVQGQCEGNYVSPNIKLLNINPHTIICGSNEKLTEGEEEDW